MVKVRSFKGFTAKPELAKDMLVLPYDVIERDQARKLSGGQKHSVYRINRPDIDFDNSINEYDPCIYEQGRENLDEFIHNGWFLQEKEKILYVYGQSFLGQFHYGLFLEASIKEYEMGIIKRHELTRQKKEQDRVKMIYSEEANAEPSLLTYNEIPQITDLIMQTALSMQPYINETTEDGREHKFWKMTPENSQKIINLFAEKVDTFYIADGHHRTQASLTVAELKREEYKRKGKKLTGEEGFEYFLCYVASTAQLNLLPYHRLIKKIKNYETFEILDILSEQFNIQKIDPKDDPTPQGQGVYAIMLNQNWYRMEIKQQIAEKDPCLDVVWLNKYLFEPIMKIIDIRTDENIDFVGGIKGLKELARRCETDCEMAVACFPVLMDEFMNICNQGEIMPPQSTWFEPKPRSGAVIRLLNQ